MKKRIESLFRGWLPKESTLPSKSTQPQVRQENKPLPKRKLTTMWLIAYFILFFFYLEFFYSQYSTLAFILIGVTSILGVILLLLRNKRNNNIMKILKYAILAVAIFVLLFASTGIYLSYIAGPVVPQISYSNILDASVAQYLQTLEQSTSFRFLQAEHVGTLTFEDLSMHSIYSNAPGGLLWTFYVGDIKSRMDIGQSEGKPYSYDLILQKSSLPQNYTSNQQITNSFEQIDSLGLHWFYDQAVGEYENATGGKPTITDLTLDIGFDNVSNYHGITLVMTGLKAGHDNFGNKIYSGVFELEFQPNGIILISNNHPFL